VFSGGAKASRMFVSGSCDFKPKSECPLRRFRRKLDRDVGAAISSALASASSRRVRHAYGAGRSASPVTVACQIWGVNESRPELLRATRADLETPLVRAYAGFCEGLAFFLIGALVEP